MYNGKTVSLKQILWRILKNPLASELTYEGAAEYAIEALTLLGAPLILIDKVTNPPIKVENYKAALPSDVVTIRGVRLLNNFREDLPYDLLDKNAIALRYATDIYHKAIPCENSEFVNETGCTEEFTYTIQKGIIFASFSEGHIQVSYKSFATDEEGFPLVPDNEKVKLALEYYILYRFLEPLWMAGKISDKAFDFIDRKKCWYMGAGNSAMKIMGPDQLESVMNSVNRLIINDKAFDNFYRRSGEKEKIRRYN